LITAEQLIVKHMDKHDRCSGICLEVLRETFVTAGLVGENRTLDLMLRNISTIDSTRYSMLLVHCINKITL
jgi:hypothetical protein